MLLAKCAILGYSKKSKQQVIGKVVNGMLDLEFKRKFSRPMYKNMRIGLGEMCFYKDFVLDNRGDPYPVVEKSEDCLEEVSGNRYYLHRGRVERIVCQFFPYGTFEADICQLDGEAGLGFRLPEAVARIIVDGEEVVFTCGDERQSQKLPAFLGTQFQLLVSCRPGAFDVYFRYREKPEYICTFLSDSFLDADRETVFQDSYVSLILSGRVTVRRVEGAVDNGVSLADLRPIRYEDGQILLEQGKVYLTASIRLQEGNYQGIFSWVPGTDQFEMTGVLFFDCGDGKWRGYLASVILRNRKDGNWYVWTSSFHYTHRLAWGSFEGDPRFGVNVVDVKLMEPAEDPTDGTVFAGIRGDEDPDLIYLPEEDAWLLAICRVMPDTGNYGYVFFRSQDPFTGFQAVGKGLPGSETGGSFVKTPEGLCFVCGNDFHATSEYRIYDAGGMRNAVFRYPDGGFRGWGTVLPLKLGSRLRYFWITFDRHKGSSYNWSYGNIYGFEGVKPE